MRKEHINQEMIEGLIEEVESMRKELTKFEKSYDKNDRRLLKSIREFNEKLLDFSNTIKLLQARKEGIDKIIEKIKKILPIV